MRYRHTDDDYHRIARQQEFVRALKEQFARNFNPLALPGIVSTITHNVEVGERTRATARCSATLLFALTLPGGHLFERPDPGRDRLEPDEHLDARTSQAVYQFTHPNVAQVRAANAATLGLKPRRHGHARAAAAEDDRARAERKRRRGRGANGAYLLRQRGLRDGAAARQRPPERARKELLRQPDLLRHPAGPAPVRRRLRSRS